MSEVVETIFIAVASGIGTGIVGLIGLAIQSRFTENGQQLTETLVEIEDVVDRAAQSAAKVWVEIGDSSSEDVAETVCLLHDIGALVSFIEGRVTNAKMSLTPALLDFRNMTSGDEFDVNGRLPDRGRVLRIRSSAASLKIACRAVNYGRRRLFPF